MSVTYLDAIREAQSEALRTDPRVYIYGQDVAVFGGAFKATKGLVDDFPDRVLDAPISEDAMIGAAIGAAAEGLRPIIEMQFADFASVAFNQIINQAATFYWRTGVSCPITIRLPCGGNPGSGPFHSQMPESLYAHVPGLIVMTPATVEDAYQMLLDAIEIEDPVIFCEHKFLYNRLKAPGFPGRLPRVNGTARIVRRGRDLTLVTYSAALYDSLAAAETVAQNGIEIEVIDLRLVKPLDLETVLGSVARTGRVLCVGESWPWGGVCAEVVASIARLGFRSLDAPPERMNCRDTPVPFHPDLWLAHKPSAESIADRITDVVSW